MEGLSCEELPTFMGQRKEDEPKKELKEQQRGRRKTADYCSIEAEGRTKYFKRKKWSDAAERSDKMLSVKRVLDLD